jgi:hypothetical protein
VRRLLHVLPVLVAVVALPLALAIAREGDAPVKATDAAHAGVSDDDGDAPLFALAALAPGKSVQRCIRVRYDGDRAGDVRLAGEVEGPSLAERIALVVERGTGGGFGGCEGFRGERVYAGTLAGFQSAQADAAWRAEDGDAATYRFTATAAADLPEEYDRAAATFTWQATVLPEDGPGGGPGPGAAPDPDAPPAYAGTPGDPAAPGAPAAPGTTTGAAPASPPAAGADGPGAAGGRRARSGGAGGAGDARGPGGGADAGAGGAGADPARPARDDERGPVARALDALGRAAVDVGTRAAFPILLLLVIALFLAAQHRIDQRDPKLALAPVQREVDLPFTPLRLASGGAPGGETRR